MPVRKAVIPAAGLGTRHFPASHAVKKELFPVVGPDGISRALIHYHLLDLIAAGIERVCLIVQPGDEDVFRNYFNGPGEDYQEKLAKYPALQEEARKMRDISARIQYVTQHTQDGLGHAVLQSRQFAANEPVIICLGDHLFRGGRTSCPAQLLTAFDRSPEKSLSAVNRINSGELHAYGTIAGNPLPEHDDLIDVTHIVEKPSLEVARRDLRTPGLSDDEFLAWFGMHVLMPSIYDILATMLEGNLRDNGELQLTRAQDIQRQYEGYRALEIRDGKRYDFGVPADFVRSVYEFSQPSL